MVTEQQLEAINRYAALMEEVKIRVAAIDFAICGSINFPAQITREFCYLQLRLLCELIALGCLTVHGEIPAVKSNKLHKEYNADKILRQLEVLHPGFYPEPCKASPQGKYQIVYAGDDSGFITKAELIKLYGRCGDYLHRGSVKKLLSPREPIGKHFPDIADALVKIQRLLDFHLIGNHTGKTVYLCSLRNSNNNNRVQVGIAETFAPEAD